MPTTVIFILLAIALVIASISGDKVKIFGLEIPQLKNPWARACTLTIAGVIVFYYAKDLEVVKNLFATNTKQTTSMQPSSGADDTAAQSVQAKNSPDNPLSGEWIDDDGTVYAIVQDGESIYCSSDSRDPAKSIRGEGMVQGNTLSLVIETNDNSTGRAELTVNSTHDAIIGTIDDSKHGKIAVRLRRR